jgi:2-methylcitrate dehydratase PrpD
MLKNGVVGIEEFAPDVIQDPVVRGLMSRTEVILDTEMEKVHDENPAKLASKVVLVLKDGRILERQVDFPKGDPDNPLTWNEAKEKFMHLAVPVYGEAKAEKLCKLIEHLEKCEDFSVDLAACLAD